MDQPKQIQSSASQPTDSPSQPEDAGKQTPSRQPPTDTVSSASTAPIASSLPPPSPSPTPNPNPNPTQPLRPSSQSVTRPSSTTTGAFSRPWQQQHGVFSSFSASHLPTSSPLLPSTSASTSSSLSSMPQRSSISIGVPASPLTNLSPPLPAQPSPTSGSFGQHFGGLSSGGANLSESNPSVSQARPMQGVHGIGMMGTLGSSSQMRPSATSGQQNQQRPVQSSLRPPSSSTGQSAATQNFQGHSLMRASSVGSLGTPPSSTSQNMQSLNQPWLSSPGSQGRPPLPPSSYRPQTNTSSMQQRSHIPQQHTSLSTTSSPSVPQQQQPLPQHQPQEQQPQTLRPPQPFSSQQQTSRFQASANQRPSPPVTTTQTNTVQSVSQSRTVDVENDEAGDRILGKRRIHELLNQIDPSQKLDPEVEDILVDIAEDFVESITTFGCSLAKHRKSDTLEAKDILLHVERNWNMRPPGFSGDEIKTYRKPLVTDAHKERLAAIKKSTMAAEMSHGKIPAGHAAVNAKGGLSKMAANNQTFCGRWR